MKNTTSLLFVLLLAFVSCQRSENSGIKPIVKGNPTAIITLFNNKSDYPIEKISLSEFVDSVKFIKIEATEECFIQYVTSAFFVENEIIIIDESIGKILVFDNEGHYIRKIGNRGRGPGEYLEITSCDYNKERQTIFVYDDASSKFLLYNITGDFIKEVSTISSDGRPLIRDIISLPNNNYLCTNEVKPFANDNYSGLWEIDSDGNFVRSLFKYDIVVPSVLNIHCSGFQRLADGTIAIRDILHYDIYHYNEREGLSRYISYETENDKRTKYQGKDYVPGLKYPHCASYKESNNFIISCWDDENSIPIYSLYDKNQNKNRFADVFDNSDIIGIVWKGGIIDSNLDNVLLVELPSTQIIKLLNEYATSESAKEILNNLEISMTEEELEAMNPVLELLYLRQ